MPQDPWGRVRMAPHEGHAYIAHPGEQQHSYYSYAHPPNGSHASQSPYSYDGRMHTMHSGMPPSEHSNASTPTYTAPHDMHWRPHMPLGHAPSHGPDPTHRPKYPVSANHPTPPHPHPHTHTTLEEEKQFKEVTKEEK
ncbi:hypothetical protein BDF14DRAFT_1808232 [Spinellus fusiger]|nr:hypothetical protein BDF14DRAFT_1808232 [Spinellus fusiger]